LIAAGAWSGALMEKLDVKVPLIAERGYHIQSARHSWPEDLPPVVFEERSIILSRFSDGLRMTSYFEFADTERLADGRKWAWLLHHVDELGIAFSKTPDKWMGSRPTLPDYLPAIGRLKSNPRVLYAFGHQHLGMTLAAITAEWIAALASEVGPQADLSFYEIERFK
jgi:D-amino-acid dehydrogenase